MNKLILFAFIIFVARASTACIPEDPQHPAATPAVHIPDFPASRNEVPVEHLATGHIIFYPPSVAKIAYIYLNVPIEHRIAVMRQHGITP